MNALAFLRCKLGLLVCVPVPYGSAICSSVGVHTHTLRQTKAGRERDKETETQKDRDRNRKPQEDSVNGT